MCAETGLYCASGRSSLCVATDTVRTTQRVGAEIQGIADTGIDAVKTMVPDLGTVAALPKVAVDAMTKVRSAWVEWMDLTTRAGTQMSQRLLWQAVEQQQRFAATAMHGWMDHNARLMKITMQVAQEGFRPFANRTGGSDDRDSTR
jgi:hypothetical protein